MSYLTYLYTTQWDGELALNYSFKDFLYNNLLMTEWVSETASKRKQERLNDNDGLDGV